MSSMYEPVSRRARGVLNPSHAVSAVRGSILSSNLMNKMGTDYQPSLALKMSVGGGNVSARSSHHDFQASLTNDRYVSTVEALQYRPNLASKRQQY